jgi:hypothetical protein
MRLVLGLVSSALLWLTPPHSHQSRRWTCLFHLPTAELRTSSHTSTPSPSGLDSTRHCTSSEPAPASYSSYTYNNISQFKPAKSAYHPALSTYRTHRFGLIRQYPVHLLNIERPSSQTSLPYDFLPARRTFAFVNSCFDFLQASSRHSGRVESHFEFILREDPRSSS